MPDSFNIFPMIPAIADSPVFSFSFELIWSKWLWEDKEEYSNIIQFRKISRLNARKQIIINILSEHLLVDLVSIRTTVLLAEFRVWIVILTSGMITYCGHRRATRKHNKENEI